MKSEQFGLKPIMPQQQLLAQQDALEGLVKDIWEKCLRVLDKKFPDLIDQNLMDQKENILNMKEDFKQLPTTDDNILFIKQTVQNVITKTSMSLMRFDKQQKAMQEQSLKWMLERMMGYALIERILKEESDSLDWCTCTAEYKRITLAILVVNETREKYPNKNQRLVYTSLASGGLLQDYVILSELLQSHTNMLVNLIDLEYPDIPTLAKKNLDPEEPRDLHMIEMKNRQEQAAIIDSFKIKMAQVISTKESTGVNYNFDVHIYQNAYEYITRAQQNPDEKSNILIMTDPSSRSFGMADFPSLANVINVWQDQAKNPIFTLYLPRHQGVHLYELVELHYDDEPLTVSERIMRYIRNQLITLITQTGANKQYTPRLVQALLDRTTLNKPVTDDVLARIGFPQLMEMRSNLKKQALKYGGSGDNLLQPLTPIKFGNAPVLLSWGSDAHITFQDLVWDALVPNAVVYALYKTDPLGQKYTDKVIKIYPETYKKSDVITPNSGRHYSYKSSDFEEEPAEEWPEEEQPIEEPEDIGEMGEPEEEDYFVPPGLYKRIL